ncbi:MAG: FtsB family cell division protein [Candidatus Gastranaerophilaceae bacterium]
MTDNNENENIQQSQEVVYEENSESLADKSRQKSKRHKRKTGFYYSFLTIVLLFCLIQIGFGVILNISKTISYRAKIGTMEKIRDAAELHNQDLKQEIKMFSSMQSLEGIARNNLKMAGEDEVLVIINNNTQDVKSSKKHHKKKKHNKK